MTRVLLGTLVALLVMAAHASAQTASAGSPRVYGSAEYLLWWLKDSPAPVPVISTNTLGSPDAQVVLGGRDIDTGERNGGRFTLGYWLTKDQAWGLEAKYFFLSGTTTTSGVHSSGAPDSQLLVAPFLCVQFCGPTPTERAQGLAIPGVFAATAIQSLTSSLKGGELNVARRVADGTGWRLELLGGFRYLNLKEKYQFTVDSPAVPPIPGHVFQFDDVFDAGNDFYGGQLGVRGEYRRRRWFASGAAKVALGVMRQRVDISGGFNTSEFSPNFGPDDTVVSFGPAQAFAGGFFAQPTNMGSHRRDVFAVVPEVGLNVGFDLTSWASVFVGYTFLYVNDVVRPGNQLDRRINPSASTQLGGPSATLEGTAAPAFRFRGTDFWAQGLNVGVTFRY